MACQSSYANNFLPISVRLDLTPEAPPLVEQLRRCVRDAVQAEVADARPPDDDETIWEYLHRTDVELWSARNFLLTPVIVIDQFEEVFTLGRKVPEKVKRFRDDLGDLVENRIPAELAERLAHADAPDGLALQSRNYKLLISLREDFLPDLEEWRPLIPLLARPRLRLLPLSTEAAFEAVMRPAANLMTEEQAHRIVRFIAGENARDDEPSPDGSGPDGHGPSRPRRRLRSTSCHLPHAR